MRLNQLNINGFELNYGFNDDNQLISVNDIAYDYDENGYFSQSSFSNIIEKYEYNNFGERSQVKVSNDNGLQAIVAMDYLYDDLGRISQITSTFSEPQGSYITDVKNYEYDLIGRLVKVTQSNGLQPIVVMEEYTYDDNGNRLTALGGITASYDNEDKLLSYGENTYTYTDRGTLLTKTSPEGVTIYTYDAFDALRKVILPDGKVIEYDTNIYDQRVTKKVNGVIVKRYVYQDELNISQELDNDGNIVVQYVYGMKQNIPEYMIKDGVKYKIISDHLGSPIMILNTATNEITKQIKYDSFGNILEDTNPDFELPFRFAGGVWDKDTKLIRFGARDYDPEIGRWLSKEPLGFTGSRNWYVYSYNNPVNWIDVDGLKPGDPFKTPDEAAKDALEYIYEESMQENKEIGGWIYQGDDDCYYASEPVKGGFMELNLSDFKFNDVAFYHSHTIWINDTSLLFSDGNGDLGFAIERNIDAYLINAIGDMSKFDNYNSETKKIGQFKDDIVGAPVKFYDRAILSYGNEVIYDK